MKRSTFIFMLTSLVMFYSCRSVKDFNYLQEVSDKEIVASSQNILINYKLKPADNLYISIKTLDPEVNLLFSPSGQTGNAMTGTTQMFGNDVSQYINGYQLDSIGDVVLPILGAVNINGMTLTQAQERIQSKALEYLKEPVVDIKLLSFRVNVGGEVARPGVYYHYQGNLTILDALSLAGGVTHNSNIRDVMVLRQKGNRTETFVMDLTSKDFFRSEGFNLYPYDMIYVRSGFNKKYELNVQTYQLVLSTISTILGIVGSTFLYNEIRF
jgi:polysaccharide biosynthesis/export protein